MDDTTIKTEFDYRVTIEKIRRVKLEGTTYKVIADTGNEQDDGKVYAYVPNGEIEFKEDSWYVFRQRLSDLDMAAVIMAVNGMKTGKE